ncbi:MAG: helix-turn-helix domain-containing protein [Candidatus Gastranaerophilales bacterium]|nr:helix-turn-helix domain-containing protein [Candidatus Gastranaerophilales bacterium]MCM1072438.1 helix-turn-helix domain-containing protein [Bacteroides sp.]
MNKLLNVQDTASYLHVSVSTLYRWVHRKEIEHVKLGSRVLFSQDYLKEFIKANTIEIRAA